MLRVIIQKLPVKRFQLKSEETAELKLYRSLNYYRGNKNALLLVPIRNFSSNQCPKVEKRHTGRNIVLGALAVGAATLGYAKYDDDFRKLLNEYVPFTDTIIKHMFQEVNSIETVTDYFSGLSNSLFGTEDTAKSSYLDTPIVKPKEYTAGDAKPKENDNYISDLESKLSEATKNAVNAYNQAIFNLRKYNKDIAFIIDEAVDKVNPETWQTIKDKTRLKNECMRRAVEKAEEATHVVNELKTVISGPEFKGSANSREMVKANIIKVQEDIQKVQNELENEKKMGSVTEKYWDKVEQARKHFSNELETLFPSIDLDKKKLKINEEDLDLFVLHTYANILFYQKELAKMETLLHDKLQKAIDAARRGGLEPLADAQICEAVEQEKRRLALCFQQQNLKIRKESESDLREQLKVQSQAFSDHLNEAINTRAGEIERELSRKFDENLEAERCRMKFQMSAIVGKLKGWDSALKEKAEADASAKRAQVLWSSCQALLRSVKAGCAGSSWKEQLKPLSTEVNAVKKAAAEKDELVQTVLASIPKEALDRGIYPENALRERFLKVEKVARSVALVPDGGASLPVHILSRIQSMLLVNAASPIPQAELNDSEVDFSKLNTYDILQRARYCLDRGDFVQTLKYMNLLKGAPRCVANQWMNETRILLETQQAANTLMAYAASSGLLYL